MDTKPLVLVVDDEPSVLRLVELELMVQGFRVVSARDGEEALTVIQDHRPDVAVVDVVMPRMSGLELMSRLKERLAIPVILLTAKTSAQDKVRGLEMGADDYIEKPFVPEDLSRSPAGAASARVESSRRPRTPRPRGRHGARHRPRPRDLHGAR